MRCTVFREVISVNTKDGSGVCVPTHPEEVFELRGLCLTKAPTTTSLTITVNLISERSTGIFTQRDFETVLARKGDAN